MTQQERDMVAIAIGKASFFYATEIDKPKISMMLDVMIETWPEATAEKLVEAIKAYQADPKNTVFPHPARLAPYVKPTASADALAQEIAGRIPKAIAKFGYSSSQAAKEFIGPLGWAAVESFGGWGPLCSNHGVSIQPGQFYAQSRDFIKAQLEIGKTGQSVDNLLEHHSKPGLDEPKVKGLLEMMGAKNVMPVGDE